MSWSKAVVKVPLINLLLQSPSLPNFTSVYTPYLPTQAPESAQRHMNSILPLVPPQSKWIPWLAQVDGAPFPLSATLRRSLPCRFVTSNSIGNWHLGLGQRLSSFPPGKHLAFG